MMRDCQYRARVTFFLTVFVGWRHTFFPEWVELNDNFGKVFRDHDGGADDPKWLRCTVVRAGFE